MSSALAPPGSGASFTDPRRNTIELRREVFNLAIKTKEWCRQGIAEAQKRKFSKARSLNTLSCFICFAIA
jgi:hypothetical protein